MNIKDKVVYFILLLLIGGAIYLKFENDKINIRMDQLNTADIRHEEKIEDPFTDSLRQYNLRFIGRGKHLRKAQNDIIFNNELIKSI